MCMMTYIKVLQHGLLKLPYHNCASSITLTSQFINHFQVHNTAYKTHLALFAIRIIFIHASIFSTYIKLQSVGNKTLYRPRRFLESNITGIDISTCRLWYAMLLTKCGDYRLSLRIIDKVLSSISPFALYYTGRSFCDVTDETKQQYVDMFSSNNSHVTERAKRAWMFDLQIMPRHMDMVPHAIQVELLHCD